MSKRLVVYPQLKLVTMLDNVQGILANVEGKLESWFESKDLIAE